MFYCNHVTYFFAFLNVGYISRAHDAVVVFKQTNLLCSHVFKNSLTVLIVMEGCGEKYDYYEKIMKKRWKKKDETTKGIWNIFWLIFSFFSCLVYGYKYRFSLLCSKLIILCFAYFLCLRLISLRSSIFLRNSNLFVFEVL